MQSNRNLPVGSVRKWASGFFVKRSGGKWVKQTYKKPAGLPPHLKAFAEHILKSAPEGSNDGLADLARAMLANDGERYDKALKAIGIMLDKPKSKTVPLLKALSHIQAEGSGDIAWQFYCARRLAKFNNGFVDMNALPGYVATAKKTHGDAIPEHT